MKQFDHEKLDVYAKAIEFVQRAATSVPLNIAEGAGEFMPVAMLVRMIRNLGEERGQGQRQGQGQGEDTP